MENITSKQLHQETKSVLDQVERGEVIVVTRDGKPIVRLEPVRGEQVHSWDEIMSHVWSAQKKLNRKDLEKNLVLEERKRRRR